jgi:energy-coupling factor transporter transmembrane protein EcfT
MTDTLIQEIIETYSWIAASLIMIFITAIAIFYQKKFGVKTFYYFYFIPILVLLIAAFHLFSYHTYLSESIELIGSGCSFLASYFLYRKMVGVK